MISTGFSRTKPAMATAVPVKALRSEITTGMSAPPIGRTIVTPKTSAAARITPRITSETVASSETVPAAPRTRRAVPATVTTARTTVRIRLPGKMIGLPLMSPISLPEAMSEPVKVTAPITTSRTTKIVVETGAPASPVCPMKSSMATRAAAPPPTALKSETSCGISVIWTLRAVYRPRPPPMTKPTTMITQAAASIPPGRVTRLTSVARTATTMPPAERRFPLRAVAGLFMRWRPRTKQTAPPIWAR